MAERRGSSAEAIAALDKELRAEVLSRVVARAQERQFRENPNDLEPIRARDEGRGIEALGLPASTCSASLPTPPDASAQKTTVVSPTVR